MPEERTVGGVIDQIERELKPKLKGKDQHLGFCKALEAVGKTLGREMPVVEPGDVLLHHPGDGPVDVKPVCPFCKHSMERKRATTESGKPAVAWLCECDPDDLEGGAGVDPSTIIPSDVVETMEEG